LIHNILHAVCFCSINNTRTEALAAKGLIDPIAQRTSFSNNIDLFFLQEVQKLREDAEDAVKGFDKILGGLNGIVGSEEE